MFLARAKFSRIFKSSLSYRYFSSLSERASANLSQFYESLPEKKLHSLAQVKELLIAIKDNKPENEAQCLNVSAPLNAFFEDNYRALNPERNIDTMREILEVGELCSQLYPTLGVGQGFRKEPWFWVWSGLEEEIRPEVRKFQIAEFLRTYQIFFANQKGSNELWGLLEYKGITFQDHEWKSEEAQELLDRQEFYSNLYKN